MPRSITTLVGFHDLLGYGDMIAASSGTLDSAVGQIAYNRILGLQRSIADVRNSFPEETSFFHSNDTVTAYLDIDIAISSSHTDPSGIAAYTPVERPIYLKLLHFLSGCARLHVRSIWREDSERLGPAGRTFVVLGKRWALGRSSAPGVFDIPVLQANLALAEAYLADKAGSREGFNHRIHERFYINDYVHSILTYAGTPRTLQPAANTRLPLNNDELESLNRLGNRAVHFPQNIFNPSAEPIRVEIFHRQRTFHSLMAFHAAHVAYTLRLTDENPTGYLLTPE